MIKTMVALTAVAAVAWGFPTMSFAYGKEHKLSETDRNFVRDDAKGVVIDKQRHLMYADEPSTGKYTFSQAQVYCRQLKYAGFEDWRLPAKEEMVSLLNNKRRDITVKRAFKNIRPDIYWIGTEASHGRIWYVDFDLGRYSKRNPRDEHRVLCVRDISAPN